MISGDDVVKAILSGEVTTYDAIYDAIKLKKETDAAQNLITVSVGDTFRFTDNSNPKYLKGLSAKVTKKNRKTVVVTTPDDSDYGRFSNCAHLKVPTTMVEKV